MALYIVMGICIAVSVIAFIAEAIMSRFHTKKGTVKMVRILYASLIVYLLLLQATMLLHAINKNR